VTWSLGSSEAAVVLGIDPDGSPLEVWLRAFGRLPRYDASGDTPATRRGKGMEFGLGMWFAQEHGLVAVPGPQLSDPPTLHPEHPFIHSRADFLLWTTATWTTAVSTGVPTPHEAVAEVKTRRFLDPEDGWGEDGSDQIPAVIKVQCLVHLACNPTARACYVVALGTVEDDLRVYVLERARYERRIARLVHGLVVWVHRHVDLGVPPEADGLDRTSRALSRGIPAADRVVATATAEDVGKVHAAVAKRATVRETEAEIEKVRQQLMLRMGAATELVDERGRLLATWRAGKTDGVRRFRWRHEINQDEEE
jgi:hypothetical protein